MTASTRSPLPAVAGPVVRLLVVALLATGLAACGAGGSGAAGDPTGPATTATLPKVTVAGDSISVGLGASLRTVLGSGVDTKVIGVEGSGLARPDRFDWPARLVELARDFPPKVLVLSLGSNDAQDLADAQGKVVVPAADRARWDEGYRARLAAAVDPFATTGTTVVWVGHVRTAEDRVGIANRHIHQLATEVAASRPFVTVADLGQLLQTGELKATRCLVPDGLHLTVACLDEAAGKLAPQLPLA